MSHPARGAWIETRPPMDRRLARARRTPRGVRGLKPPRSSWRAVRWASHPARGAWIETSSFPRLSAGRHVAPRAGCVD